MRELEEEDGSRRRSEEGNMSLSKFILIEDVELHYLYISDRLLPW